MVTQDSYLFHATIRQNLLYAKPDATDEEMHAAARAAQIHERIMSFDGGYDTMVGERGFRLSGGEKQRLAIARVILKDPRVLILDEATSALDTRERASRAGGAAAADGRPHHHRDRAPPVDDPSGRRDLRVDAGRIVEHGNHDELLERGGLYAKLYEEQFEAEARSAPRPSPARRAAARALHRLCSRMCIVIP